MISQFWHLRLSANCWQNTTSCTNEKKKKQKVLTFWSTMHLSVYVGTAKWTSWQFSFSSYCGSTPVLPFMVIIFKWPLRHRQNIDHSRDIFWRISRGEKKGLLVYFSGGYSCMMEEPDSLGRSWAVRVGWVLVRGAETSWPSPRVSWRKSCSFCSQL